MPKTRKRAIRPVSSKSSRRARPKGKPLPAQMLDLITGYWVSRMVYVVARLGIADLLAKKARSAADLAGAAGVDADRLFRVLRALAACGVFVEKAGRFRLTPLGETLRTDVPASMRDFALMMVEDYNQQAWMRLLDGVRAPVSPFDLAHGQRIFPFFEAHPEHLAVFARSMASISGAENPAIAAALDCRRVQTLVDVGGSQGHLLATILRANPKLRGVLFDLPSVVAGAKDAPFLAEPAVRRRVEFVAGSFFESVPAADAYIMKYILHDWTDDECVRILSRCRAAMAKGGRVLVVDCVIPPGNDPHWGKMLDVNMLALTTGRERTKAEFADLFARAGLRLKKVHATECPLSIIEGVAR